MAGCLIEPDRTGLAYVERLRSINLRDCSPEFRRAFEEYIDAWAELATSIANHTGLPGIVEAYKGGIVSVLDLWIRVHPGQVSRVRKAEAELDRFKL